MTKIKILQFPIANSKGGITHYALDNWKWMDKRKKSLVPNECHIQTMLCCLRLSVRSIIVNMYNLVNAHRIQSTVL